jgi:hypothetical protein
MKVGETGKAKDLSAALYDNVNVISTFIKKILLKELIITHLLLKT